ncbi:MAG: proline--tRNA ligase, partial [Thiomargarita sp.]|nr:proline--tRNA ligase [Thiomargarita sp.]
SQTVKTLIVNGKDSLVALILRGDHSLNVIKAAKLPQIGQAITFANPDEIKETIGCDIGSIGLVNLSIPIVVDHGAAHLADFVCGANQNGKHLQNVNWGRDCPEAESVDIRNVETGDMSPDGHGTLKIARGIEVGHIFQLGDKYSKAMQATVLNEAGNATTLIMGCYGIGVSRVVAAAIEQNNDKYGIIWPAAIAPFSVALLPMNMHKSQRLRDAAESLYKKLLAAKIEVLFDDRRERPGVMFADSELIGIPHRLVIGERGLDKGEVEYKTRNTKESQHISIDNVIDFIQQQI